MKLEELVDKMNGFIAAGRGIVRVNGRAIEVGRIVDGVGYLNDDGKRFAEIESSEEAEFEEIKPKRKRRTKEEMAADAAEEVQSEVGLG